VIAILDLEFKSTQPFGQDVVQRRENHEKNEAKYSQDDRHADKDDALNPYGGVAKDQKRNPNQGINEAHQEIERGEYLAGLENRNTGQLLFHGALI
jgi:hypothetical protein